jgi:hypothetical protein
MPHIRLVSTGRHLPGLAVTNDMLRARFDARIPDFVNKMEESTGIEARGSKHEVPRGSARPYAVGLSGTGAVARWSAAMRRL